MLPDGAGTPALLVEIPDDTWGVAFMVHGAFVYWWTDTVDATGAHRLAQITCPA